MIMTSADTIVIMILRDFIPVPGVYETVKSTPSIMDYPYAKVLEYRSQRL